MEFLNPYLLLGLLGISVPILIHLLNRFRYRQVDWAAMELLRRALVVRSRRIRIEDLILLLLRCTAVALIALAFARPVLMPSGVGEDADVGAVVGLDASYSMAHRPAVHSRHDRALERVEEVFGSLPAGAPVTALSLGARPRILLRHVGFEASRFEETLERERPLPERLGVEACLEEMVELTKEMRAPAKECYIVTDAQTTTWSDISEKARALLKELSAQARIFFLPISAAGDENVAVVGLEFVSGAPQRGAVGRFIATVRNAGSRELDQASVALALDGTAVDERIVDRLEPGESAEVALLARFGDEGSQRLEARIGEDPLSADNQRYLVVEARERLRVLVVDGEPSAAPYGGEARFLVTALTAGTAPGDADAPISVTSVPWLDLASQTLGDFDVVFLVDLPDVHPEQAGTLARFVRAGGGLFLFLGDNADPSLLEEHLHHEGDALLPGELLGAAAAPSEAGLETATPWDPTGGETARTGKPLRLTSPQHPLSRAAGTLKPELLEEARFYRQHRLRLHDEGRAMWHLAGEDSPLLSERKLGAGRVIVMTSSTDWSNIVTHPVYPILVREAVTYLTRREREEPVTVGAPIAVPLPEAGDRERVAFRDPEGNEVSVQVAWLDGRRFAELPAARLPGFYEVPGEGDSYAAVNVDPAESDVRVLTSREAAAAFRDLRVRVVPEEEDLAAAVREGRIGKEIWLELLAAGLFILVVEAILARWFSRRTVHAEGGR